MVTTMSAVSERYKWMDVDMRSGLDFSKLPKWNISDKIAIKVALTGSAIMRETNPNQPYSEDEIRNEAIKCIEAGAVAVHFHPRTVTGGRPDQAEYIKKLHTIIDPLKEKYGDKVIFDGCTARPRVEDEIELWKTGLFEMSPLNPWWDAPKTMLQAEAENMQKCGVKPEIALYCDGDLHRAYSWLIEPGLMQKPLTWLLVPAFRDANYPGGTPLPNEFAMVEYLLWTIRRIREIDPDSVISVCEASRPCTYLSTQAMIMGLNIRVGMEDTIYKWPHKDDILKSNADSYKTNVEIARLLGRQQMTAAEYRKHVGLPIK